MDRSFVVAGGNCRSGFTPTGAAAAGRTAFVKETVQISRLARPPNRASRIMVTELDAELLAASTPLKHIVVPPMMPPSQELHDAPLHPIAPPRAVPSHHNHPAAGPQGQWIERSPEL